MKNDTTHRMRCPRCGSAQVIKRGTCHTNIGERQRYLCKACTRRFIGSGLKFKQYAPHIIYGALTHYNQGMSGRAVSTWVNKTFKVKTGKSTIYSWVNEFQKLCPIVTKRDHLARYDPVIRTKRFEHENLNYEFMYHRYKLDTLGKDRFPGLYAYLTRLEREGCPDVFFTVGERCSRPVVTVPVSTVQKRNLACEMAAFAVQAARDHRERHQRVEHFMITSDLATVACEVPVWYWEKQRDTGMTGHIDLVQVRNNLVYVLDYKPEASKEKKAPWQLYHYAMALAFRTKIPLQCIRCAWFDEEAYYEYPLGSVHEMRSKNRETSLETRQNEMNAASQKSYV